MRRSGSWTRFWCAFVVSTLVVGGAGIANAAKGKAGFKKLEDAAFKAYGAGEYAEALELYTKVYDLKPSPGTLYNMARCHDQLGAVDDAARTYEEFLAANAALEEPDAELAGKARDHLLKLLKTDGNAKLLAADWAGALERFEHAAKFATTPDPDVLAGEGQVLVELGRAEEAIPLLEKALPLADAAVRARVEASLAKARATTAPPPVSGDGPAPDASPADGTGPLVEATPALTPDPTPPPAKKKSSAGIWIGVGAGVVAVGAVVAVLAVALRPHVGLRIAGEFPEGNVLDIRDAAE